ncbi:MAG: NAD(P)H-binding protein [Candidatus Woesearchaeota archaeon]
MLTKKTIALFGATGKTGQIFLKKALQEGFRVQALVRSPAKLDSKLLKNKSLTIIEGDVLKKADVFKTIKKSHVVVSLIGHNPQSPENLQTTGVKYMTQAMKDCKVTRIFSLTGAALAHKDDRPTFLQNVLNSAVRIIGNVRYTDSLNHAKVLERSNLNWTIIRANILTDVPKQKYVVDNLSSKTSLFVSRHAITQFIIDNIKSKKYYKKMPCIGDSI